jgi:AcrR family transcriptional regulator
MPLGVELFVSSKPRTRNARAAANDVAIANAAVSEILRVGVDRVSLREVALRAGLTHGAAYARYEDVSELLIDLWHSRLSAVAVELLDLSMRAAEEQSEATLRALFDRIRQPRPEDLAMVEMLLVSRRMPILHEETEPFIKKHFHREDDLTEESRALFTRSLSLFGLAMVSVFEGHYFNDDQNHIDVMENALVTALREKPSGVTPGETVSDEMARPGDEDDNLRARLVYATYVVVAKSGYHEATVSRIARRTDCSPGAIYKLYRSKQDLVLDSFRAVFGPGTFVAGAPRDLSEIFSHGSRRQTSRRVSFVLETTIAAAHNETLRATVGAYLGDPERRMAHREELADTERAAIAALVHSMAALAHGMQWMSVVMASESADCEEFSESFRVALLNVWASTDS